MPARTPEELEQLLEDACLLRDSAALADLYESHGRLVAAPGEPVAYGTQAIARAAAAWWKRGGEYVADPLSIVQARGLALIVARDGISVARHSDVEGWRYAITLVGHAALVEDAAPNSR
jgi:hypothetical protein